MCWGWEDFTSAEEEAHEMSVYETQGIGLQVIFSAIVLRNG